MKKIFIISLLVYSLNANMGDRQWQTIGQYIVSNADGSEKDLEAAKQALLNIEDDDEAADLAEAINGKWPKESEDRLLQLTRYPNIKTEADIKEAGKKLFKEHKDFINNTLEMDCKIE